MSVTAELGAIAFRRWRSLPRVSLAAAVPFLTPALLAFSVGLNLYQLRPELTVVPFLHDGVQHFLSVNEALRELKAGNDPTDTWVPGMVIGFPLFHYYQHLPYVMPALVAFLTGEIVSTDILFRWVTYLLLSIFPLSIYWAMRRLGFDRVASVGSALAAPLLSTNGLFGFDMGSYTWRGFGLYTQLWGMIFLPPALAQGYAALRDGRGYFLAVLLLTATALSHLAFAYIAFVSIALLAAVTAPRSEVGIWAGRLSMLLLLIATALAHLPLVCIALALVLISSVLATPRIELATRFGRLLLVMIPLGITTSYFLLSLVLDRAYIAHSVWDAQWKYDSFGAPKILEMLRKGEVFDAGRSGILTAVAGVGLLVCIWRWSEPKYRLPAFLGVFWLLAWFGRPFWGALLDYTPLSKDFYFHRLGAGVHLGGLFLIGIGLSLAWHWTRARLDARLIPPVILTIAIALPLYRDRADFLSLNDAIMQNNRNAFAAEQRDLDGLLSQLGALPPGRVYAGLAGTWGSKYQVGEVYMYSLLTQKGFDVLSFLYHVWSLNGDVMTLMNEHDPAQMNLFAIKYVVAPQSQPVPDFVRLIGSHGRHRLYEVDSTTGYFDLVTAGPTFVGDRDTFYPAASYWQGTDRVRAKEHPILSFEGPGADRQAFPLKELPQLLPAVGAGLDQPNRGRILSERVGPSLYETNVQVDQASTLMLKVSYHPNWRAYVDDVEVRPVQLLPSYPGVSLTPGIHQVRLEYRPQLLRTILLFTGLLTFVLLAVAERRRDVLARALARLPLERVSEPLLRIPSPGAPAWVGKTVEDLMEGPRRRATAWRAGARLTGQRQIAAAQARALAAVATVKAWARPTASAAWVQVRPHTPYLGGVMVLTLLGGWPLLQGKLMSGHDYLEYLPRNVEFWRALTGGQIIPRWAPDLSAGYGEPFFNFNPPLIYASTSFFHALGFSFLAAENLAALSLLALAGLGMYLLAQEFFGKHGGVVAASAYIFAPFLHSRLYVSHALADYSAFPFVPFAFWGLYRFAETGRYRFLVIGAGAIALLTLASNPISLITLPFLGLLVVLLTLQWRSLRVAIRGAACVGLGMALSAFFWLPALAERDFVHVHRLLETFLNYTNHFAYVQQLVWLNWGYGVSVPGLGDGMSFTLGAAHLGAAAASALLFRWIWRKSQRAGVMVGFALVVAMAAAFMSIVESRFIWERLPLLQYLEYPWRFHILANACMAFLFGVPFLFLRRRPVLAANATMAALVGLVLLFNLSHARPEKLTDVREADFTPQIIAQRYVTTTTALEYEPIWVLERPGLTAPAPPPVTVVDGEGQTSVQRRTPTELQFRSQSLERLRLRLNTFYFPGWTLYVDGDARPVERNNAQGVMEFTLAPGVHNVRLAFEDTPVRQWGSRLSLLALLVLLGALWLPKARRGLPTIGIRVTHRRSGVFSVGGSGAAALTRLVQSPAVGVIVRSLSARPVVSAAAGAFLAWLAAYQLVGLNPDSLRDLYIIFNDATSYITTARNLAERGEVTPNVIYPSLLGASNTTKDYFYMPGYFASLATTFKVFGFGEIQALGPSLAGFVAGAGALLFIARRLYGGPVATLAVALFVLFPASLVLSHTAFSDMTTLGVTALAFAGFLLVPERYRPVAGPILVALPLLFREVAALVAAPMLALVAYQGGRWRLKQAGAFLLLSAVVVLLVLSSDLARGRPPMVMITVFDYGFDAIHSDALPLLQMHPSLGDWLTGLANRWATNWRALWQGPPPYTSQTLEVFTPTFVLAAVPLGLIVGWRRRDPFLVGAPFFIFGLFASIMVAHHPWNLTLTRILLIGQPFAAIVWALSFHGAIRCITPSSPWQRGAALATLVTAFGLLGVSVTREFFDGWGPYRARQQAATGFLESIQHDDRYLLSAPHELSFGYIYKHYPVRWSFLPANQESLTLLQRRFPVSTVVLPLGTDLTTLSPEILERGGFKFEGHHAFRGISYLVFKRDIEPAAGPAAARV